jgi:hypothetical protein
MNMGMAGTSERNSAAKEGLRQSKMRRREAEKCRKLPFLGKASRR